MKGNNSQAKAYGQHLLLDCYDADEKRLADLQTIYTFLDELPALIGMEKIGPPQLVRFKDKSLAGVTGILMIVTSHISIHTYNLKKCCFIDIFSCKAFDDRLVERHVKSTFSVGRIERTLVQRGLHFPERNLIG